MVVVGAMNVKNQAPQAVLSGNSSSGFLNLAYLLDISVRKLTSNIMSYL